MLRPRKTTTNRKTFFIASQGYVYIRDVPFRSSPIRSEPVPLRTVPVGFVPILSRSAGQAGLDFGTAFRLERNRSVLFHTASGRVWSGLVRSGLVLSALVQSGPIQLHRTRPFPSKQQPIWSVRPGPVGSSSVRSGPVRSGQNMRPFHIKPVRSVPRHGRSGLVWSGSLCSPFRS